MYLVAGCNGAGKTTASFTILPEIIECREFVNADEIARGLSPFQPEKAAFESGRIMLARINKLLNDRETFALETTLATKLYKGKIWEARARGYTITLLFFWLQSIELAKERVRTRVLEGGHYIESDVIERRYKKGVQNLFDIYLPIVDRAFIFDNSAGKPTLVAQKGGNQPLNIFDEIMFNKLMQHYENR